MAVVIPQHQQGKFDPRAAIAMMESFRAAKRRREDEERKDREEEERIRAEERVKAEALSEFTTEISSMPDDEQELAIDKMPPSTFFNRYGVHKADFKETRRKAKSKFTGEGDPELGQSDSITGEPLDKLPPRQTQAQQTAAQNLEQEKLTTAQMRENIQTADLNQEAMQVNIDAGKQRLVTNELNNIIALTNEETGMRVSDGEGGSRNLTPDESKFLLDPNVSPEEKQPLLSTLHDLNKIQRQIVHVSNALFDGDLQKGMDFTTYTMVTAPKLKAEEALAASKSLRMYYDAMIASQSAKTGPKTSDLSGIAELERKRSETVGNAIHTFSNVTALMSTEMMEEPVKNDLGVELMNPDGSPMSVTVPKVKPWIFGLGSSTADTELTKVEIEKGDSPPIPLDYLSIMMDVTHSDNMGTLQQLGLDIPRTAEEAGSFEHAEATLQAIEKAIGRSFGDVGRGGTGGVWIKTGEDKDGNDVVEYISRDDMITRMVKARRTIAGYDRALAASGAGNSVLDVTEAIRETTPEGELAPRTAFDQSMQDLIDRAGGNVQETVNSIRELEERLNTLETNDVTIPYLNELDPLGQSAN